jgi:acetyl/propionyl-CoA carboxylase alpha subunit
MDYKLKIGQDILSMDVGPLDENGSCAVTGSKDTINMAIEAVSQNRLALRINGQATDLYVAPGDEGTWIWIDGRARFVQDADKLERRKSQGPVEAKPKAVSPPTPATVVRILVNPGDNVEEGQPCAVVVSMKMEITLPAPYAGTVKAINAGPGDQVSTRDILVEIEPKPKDDDEEEGRNE